MSKAKKLLGIAYAAFKRGEPEIAKNIFVLAAEEPDAPETMGDEPAKQDPEVLKAKIAKALQDGNIDEAESCLAELKACSAVDEEPAPVDAPPADEPSDEPAAAADEEPVEEVPVDEEPPAEAAAEDEEQPEEDADEIPPAQVASLVKIAKKIAAAGHRDLAERITAALAR